MLVDPIPLYRRSRRAKARAAVAPVVAVRVVSVALIDTTGAVWTFDAPVRVLGQMPVPQLRILTPSGWQSAVTLGDWETDNAIACDVATGDLDAGQAWEIVGQPVGIDFASGVLVLPQGGVTVWDQTGAGRGAKTASATTTRRRLTTQ